MLTDFEEFLEELPEDVHDGNHSKPSVESHDVPDQLNIVNEVLLMQSFGIALIPDITHALPTQDVLFGSTTTHIDERGCHEAERSAADNHEDLQCHV
jgi:hypothetical protein